MVQMVELEEDMRVIQWVGDCYVGLSSEVKVGLLAELVVRCRIWGRRMKMLKR